MKNALSISVLFVCGSLSATAFAEAPKAATAPSVPYMQRYAPEAGLWELGLFGGAFFPSDSHNLRESGRPQQPFKTAGELGARIGYYPLVSLGVEVEAAAMPSELEDGSAGGLFAARGHVIGQLPTGSIVPFVLAGAGVLGASSTRMGSDTDPAIHFGAGAKAALDSYLSLRLDLRDTLSQKTGSSQGTETHHPEVLLGLTFTLERSRPDADGDGFADHRDDCPLVAGSEHGCPKPEPASAEPACPETKCPETKCACSDRDGDGRTDATDRCPEQAADTADGCPDRDRDKDGVENEADRCPDQAEAVNGFQDDDGCPDEVPAEVKRFSGVVRGIEFAYNSAEIRKTSTALLDDAAKVLKQYPELRLEIVGHTDAQGPREHNLQLSLARAESVKNYLAGQGVDAARLKTRGAGPDEPIADNGTEAGRKQNRRIEFKNISQ